jgi:hypothetical protein
MAAVLNGFEDGKFLMSNIRFMKKKKGGETNKNKGLSKEQVCHWLKNCCKNWTLNIIFELIPLLVFSHQLMHFHIKLCNSLLSYIKIT